MKEYEDHLAFFLNFADNMNVEEEDVYMKLFVYPLDGEVHTWFRQLPIGCITSCVLLDDTFLMQLGEKNDHLYCWTKFYAIKRENGEVVSQFIKRFNKIYNKVPSEINPSPAKTMAYFVTNFGSDFTLMLRERRFDSLGRM